MTPFPRIIHIAVIICFGSLCLGSATSAFAQQAGPIRWQQSPRFEQFVPLSAELGIHSVAQIECEVTDSPRLTCIAVDESPLGFGVGQAGVDAYESALLVPDQSLPSKFRQRVVFNLNVNVERTEWTGYRPSQREIEAQRERISQLPQMPGFIFNPPSRLTATGAMHRERLLRIQEQVEMEFRPRLSETWAIIAARTREKKWSEREAARPVTFWLRIWSMFHPEAADLQNQVNDRVREIFCEEIDCSPIVSN